MPWNDKSGGGGPWGGGGNGGGPWGQGPRGPSGPQGAPPDLEDIIRRGQDRLKQALPGGGNASPALFGLIGLALVALWLFQSIYTVQPDELRRRAALRQAQARAFRAGPAFPLVADRDGRDTPTPPKSSSRSARCAATPRPGLMLSGDQNIVDVKFSVAYQVSDPEAYLFNVSDPDEMVRQIGESAMREAVGRRPAQDIFRDDRQGIADAVRGIIQTTLDEYGAGLAINAISIEDAAPPREVADAFDEVQRAEQDEDRFVEESNQYSNQKLGQARGEAAQIREEAAAYKNRVVQEAEGEAQRFISVYDEYAKAPDVTRERLFIETMEKVLKDSNKVIVEQGSGQGVVPYLPLPELQKRAPASPAEPVREQTDGQPSSLHRRHRRRHPVPDLFVGLRGQRAPAGDRAALRRDRRRQDASPASISRRRSPSSRPTTCRSSRTASCASTSTTSASRFRAASSTRSTPSSPTASPIARTFRQAVSGSVRACRSSGCAPASTRRLRRVYGVRGFESALSEERAAMMREVRDQLRPDADVARPGDRGRAHPPHRPDAEVSQQTYDRMKAERLAEAERLRARGREAAQRIRARADREVVEIVAEARKESEILRGEGEAAAQRASSPTPSSAIRVSSSSTAR